MRGLGSQFLDSRRTILWLFNYGRVKAFLANTNSYPAPPVFMGSHVGNGRCSRLGWQISWCVRERGGPLSMLTTSLEGVYIVRCSSRPVSMVFIATLVP